MQFFSAAINLLHPHNRIAKSVAEFMAISEYTGCTVYERYIAADIMILKYEQGL